MDERRENLIILLTLMLVLSIGLTFTTALSLALNFRLLNLMEQEHDQKTADTNRPRDSNNP
jgi:hypothetical protein